MLIRYLDQIIFASLIFYACALNWRLSGRIDVSHVILDISLRMIDLYATYWVSREDISVIASRGKNKTLHVGDYFLDSAEWECYGFIFIPPVRCAGLLSPLL